MREIKYRVWDKTEGKMCSVARISFGDDGAALTILAEPAPIGEFYRGLVEGESGILMQFTGLKDKNGKDIYEGDILQEDDTTANPTGNPFQVEWRDARSGWNLFEYGDYYEVIGNIFENLELL